jgi:hypothetical protein
MNIIELKDGNGNEIYFKNFANGDIVLTYDRSKAYKFDKDSMHLAKEDAIIVKGTIVPEIIVTPIIIMVSGPNGDKPFKLTKEDVWGEFDSNYNTINKGMIVARHKDICPHFGDVVPYKAITVICNVKQEDEVIYWLEYVHGANCISGRKTLKDGNIALRSDYQCW